MRRSHRTPSKAPARRPRPTRDHTAVRVFAVGFAITVSAVAHLTAATRAIAADAQRTVVMRTPIARDSGAASQPQAAPDPRLAAHLVAARLASTPLDERWRARGVAFLDLPLGVRARYDAQALHRFSPRNDFAAPFFDQPLGPAQRSGRLLESRFALSRPVARRIELELSWAARSPLTMVDLLRVEDQRVTAMIRFVP